MDNETLHAMRELLAEEREHTRQLIKEELKPIKDDLAELKDESKITRHSVNLLLRWAERADKSVNIGLYEE